MKKNPMTSANLLKREIFIAVSIKGKGGADVSNETSSRERSERALVRRSGLHG